MGLVFGLLLLIKLVLQIAISLPTEVGCSIIKAIIMVTKLLVLVRVLGVLN